MMRSASLSDLNFIFTLILAEAKNGHFARELLIPGAMRGFETELRSILTNRVRPNGMYARAFIWEVSSKPVGFIVTTTCSPDNEGIELWMSALCPENRGVGEGKKLILDVLRKFQGKRLILLARCAPESKAMFHILTSNGFKHCMTTPENARVLMYTHTL